jgi:hypothetical protein
MVGIDTGFFVGLMKGDSKPIKFWASLVDSDTMPVVSMLTLGAVYLFSAGTTGQGQGTGGQHR